jgi:DUF4097 and DUF4098 domain-containing protein YvlB
MVKRTGHKLTPAHAAPLATGLAFAGLIGFASVVLPPATTQAGPYKLTDEDNQTVRVEGQTRLYVKNPRGKTIIVGKQGAREVAIRAEKFVQAKNRETAEEWMEELTFRIDRDGQQISIITDYPSGGVESLWAFLRGTRLKALVEFTIEVPAYFDAEVSSASGDVQVTSIDGGCEVYGSSGDVFLKTIGGDAFVEVSSGDIEVTDVRGDIRLGSSSGDALIRGAGGSISLSASSGDMEVHRVTGDATVELDSGDFLIQGCEGDVVARTSSGNAVLRDVLGGVRASASSGDVTMSIIPVGNKEFVVKTASGDVSVMFAAVEQYGFLLDVSTASGSIEGDLDIRLDKVSRRVLRGVVGSGEGKLMIETSSGNIVIQQARNSR